MSTERNHGTETAIDQAALLAIRTFLGNDHDSAPPADMLRAIQRDSRIDLDDDEIVYVLQDARRECMDTEMALARLIRLGQGVHDHGAKPLPR